MNEMNNNENVAGVSPNNNEVVNETERISPYMTLKCSNCGTEVVVNSDVINYCRCHWCRNTLTLNNRVEDGVVPSLVLPFVVTKEEARTEIEKFSQKRKFFAHPKFLEEFKSDNIMGVYLPYVLIDVHNHAHFVGQGEKLINKYTQGEGSDAKTCYDAELYDVEREFDVVINNFNVNAKKNLVYSVVNSVMPFDIERSVLWNNNYLRGYMGEKMVLNYDDLKPILSFQNRNIVKGELNKTLEVYDRGVNIVQENIDVKNEVWKVIYLPVWVYSYQEKIGEKKILHYMVVNARTKSVAGSVPVYLPKLLIITGAIEVLAIIMMIFDKTLGLLLAVIGFVFLIVIQAMYRKTKSKKYEAGINANVENLRKVDNLILQKKGLHNAKMEGANNVVDMNNFGEMMNNIVEDNPVMELVNKLFRKK